MMMKNRKKVLAVLLAAAVTGTGFGAGISVPDKGYAVEAAESDFEIKNGVLTQYTGLGGNVVIPEGVTSIGGHAFWNCSSLVGITIPEGVTSIGGDAFSDCSSLTSITIPEGVTSIGEYAFSGCSSLTSITIPEGVTSIGRGAFDRTKWLEDRRAENPLVIVGNILIDGRTCSGDVAIPEGVTGIGEMAFGEYQLMMFGDTCSSLTSITIPNSVTSIGSEAFGSCSSLTSITIPEGVTSIGKNAFSGTRWLKDRRAENPLVIVNNILIDGLTCSGDVVIPEGVTSIGAGAFANNFMLTGRSCDVTSITIPDSVTSIENGAIYECWSLKSIKGYTGSYAETYAKENGYEFISLGNIPLKSKTFYNVTGNDDTIDLSDAQKMLKLALKIEPSSVAYTLTDAQNCLKIALRIVTLE